MHRLRNSKLNSIATAIALMIDENSTFSIALSRLAQSAFRWRRTMENHGRTSLFIALLALALGITGCMQTTTAGPDVHTGDNRTLATKTQEMVNQLVSDISEARKQHVDLLSPEHFDRAQKALDRARKNLAKGADVAAIRSAVMNSREQLRKAEAMARVSRTLLADTLAAREKARDAGATEFQKEYRQVENDLLDLSRAIENDNADYARRQRDEVTDGYRNLEVRAIKEKAIGSVRRLVTRAEAADARKIAPVSYARAVGQLNAADAFISAHPHAEAQINAMAAAALFQANRLVAVTQMSNRVKAMKPEEITLALETYLHTISAELDAQDFRDRDYQTQVDAIVASVDALKHDRDAATARIRELQSQIETLNADYQTRIDALNIRMATLEGKSREDQMARERMARERMAAEQRLAAARKLAQQYAAIQDYFKTDEAEVYKQESQIMIRLKAMHFPVGKSTILPENEALLGKVQRAIRIFEDPRVVVEGHTDATGSDEVNTLLSQQRADAVRDYLIASQTLPPESISAVGYGAKHPLASNATSAGRAINRRIDILIIPRSSPI
jgi:OmpA-OmpF porin, OOP family